MSIESSETILNDANPWNQRMSLKPPPYSGAMRRMLGGLNIGDARIDALPSSAVCCHGGKARKIGLEPTPEWVDMESVRRGQLAFRTRMGQHYIVLSLALLQGFSIGRFAEVLNFNGYAQSGETAFERYRETGFAIVDWMSYPLDEEDSKASEQLQNVRAMHSFARRKSQKLFDQSKGEGIALSQYDMAEVQLAFAGIVPNVLEREMGVTMSRQEKADLCHCWRLVGYHLGIHDEFNVCNDLDDLEAIVDDWFQFNEQRFSTCRPATMALQRTAIEGFGKFTGVGTELFVGLLHATLESRGWQEIDYLERPCLPGMQLVGKTYLQLVGKPWVNKVSSFGVAHMRQRWLKDPATQRSHMKYLALISRVNDAVLWKVVGLLALQIKATAESRERQMLIGCLVGFMTARSARNLVKRFSLLL